MSVTCKCGCDLFEQVIPCSFDQTDFRAWNSGQEIKPEVKAMVVMRCLQCSKLLVPPSALVGKTALDPAVQAYSRLIDYVKAWNKGLETFNHNADVLQKNVNRLHELEAVVSELQKTPELPELREVVEDLSTTKPGKKKLKNVKAS